MLSLIIALSIKSSWWPLFRWVELERPLKKQLDKFAQDPYLYLGVMFYVNDVSLLEDEVTRWEQLAQLLHKGQIIWLEPILVPWCSCCCHCIELGGYVTVRLWFQVELLPGFYFPRETKLSFCVSWHSYLDDYVDKAGTQKNQFVSEALGAFISRSIEWLEWPLSSFSGTTTSFSSRWTWWTGGCAATTSRPSFSPATHYRFARAVTLGLLPVDG